MNFCFLYEPAVRRHLDDGQPLSQRAQSHLRKCKCCRAMVAEHSKIITQLSANKLESMEAPAFLHARIINSIRTEATPRAQQNPVLRFAMGAATVALVATAVVVLKPKQPEKIGSWPTFPAQIAFKPAFPQNPLESEIENLRADTLNVAKALASNFLPETEAAK